MSTDITESQPKKVTEPLLICADDLAELLNISIRTLWRKLSAKKIPEPVRIGELPRWRLDQVRQWIDQGCPPQGKK